MIFSAFVICTNFIYLMHVGTEDGKVYKCSKAYSAHYLDVYEVKFIYKLQVYFEKFTSKNHYIIKLDFGCVKSWYVNF